MRKKITIIDKLAMVILCIILRILHMMLKSNSGRHQTCIGEAAYIKLSRIFLKVILFVYS